MRKLLMYVGLVSLAVAGWSVALPATSEAAAGTSCTGELAPGTYHKLVVPDGETCLSEGPITVRGGIQVGAGANVRARQ